MSESLFSTEVPDSGLGDLADLGGGGHGGTTATTLAFAADGTVTGVRFYAPATVSGAHTFTAELWAPSSTDGAGGSGTGSRLAAKSVSGAAISAAGWNSVLFDTPVSVTAGTPYRFAIHNSAGRYVAVAGYFSIDHVVGNVTGFASPHTFGVSPGSLRTATFAGAVDANTYPTSFFGSPTYLIDCLYDAGETGDNTAPSVSLAVVAGALSVAATATVVDDAPAGASYRWKWGDGATTVTSVPTANHTYAAAGVYPVIVTVTDVGGLADSAAAMAVVRPATGGLDLDAVAREIADRIGTISGLSSYPWQPGSITPPAAMVLNPPEGGINYGLTYGRGDWSLTLPVLLVIGRASERAAQQKIRGYLSDAGSTSIRAAIESGVYAHLDDLRVNVGGVDGVLIGGVEYLAALVDIEIMGS